MTKKFLTCMLMLLITYSLFSQSASIQWGPYEGSLAGTSGMMPGYKPQYDILYEQDNILYVIAYKSGGAQLDRYKYFLEAYDVSSLELKSSKELDLGMFKKERGVNYLGYSYDGNSLFILLMDRNNSTNSLSIQCIEFESGSDIQKPIKELFSVKNIAPLSYSAGMEKSKKGNFLLLYAYPKTITNLKKEEKSQIAIFDKHLNAKGSFEVPAEVGGQDIDDLFISDNMDVFGTRYTFNKQPTFTCYHSIKAFLYRGNSKETKVYDIVAPNGKAVVTPVIGVDLKGDFLMLRYYCDYDEEKMKKLSFSNFRGENFLHGVAVQKLDHNSMNFSAPKLSKLPESINKEMYVPHNGLFYENRLEFDESNTPYSVLEICYYYTSSSATRKDHILFNSFSQNGEVETTKVVGKKQIGNALFEPTIGFDVFDSNGKYYLFFNDEKENVSITDSEEINLMKNTKKSVLVCVELGNGSNVLKWPVYDYKENKSLAFYLPQTFLKTNSGGYYVLAEGEGKRSIGKLIIK